MTESTFEGRVHTWLEAGPTELPPDAIGNVVAAIDGLAQDRPALRVFRRAITPFHLRLAAAAIVLLIGTGAAIWVRSSISDVANQRDPSDLLYAFPDTTTVIEQSGVTSTEQTLVEIGGLHAQGAFELVGSCLGGDGMVAQVFLPAGIQAVPSGGDAPPPQRIPWETLLINCDGLVQHRTINTQTLPAGENAEVALTVSPGVTWRFAVGEYRASSGAPTFPVLEPEVGFYVVMDLPATLVTSELGFGVEPPERADVIAVVVRCTGDPISLSDESGDPPTRILCDDRSEVARVRFSAIGRRALNFRVTTEGITWVRATAEADGEIMSDLPTAPPLPPGIADVRFAESDGQYLAFGSLGSNRQTTVHAPDTFVGVPGGDFITTIQRAPDGTRVDLWSISTASKIRTLALIDQADNFGPSWVDATHERVYYTVFKANFTAEWHRVAFDGTEDRIIATAPDGSVISDGALALDDSMFVVEWCPIAGPCTRVVDDIASGETRQIEPDGDRTCAIRGVVSGQIVALTGPTCAEGDSFYVSVQDVDGGPRRRLVDGTSSGVVARASDGDRYIYWLLEGKRTTHFAVPISGGEASMLATVEHDGVFELPASTLRLPVGDWILLSGPLGGTPSNQRLPTVVPRLLNVVTRETIELVNLPHNPP